MRATSAVVGLLLNSAVIVGMNSFQSRTVLRNKKDGRYLRRPRVASYNVQILNRQSALRFSGEPKEQGSMTLANVPTHRGSKSNMNSVFFAQLFLGPYVGFSNKCIMHVTVVRAISSSIEHYYLL